MTNGIDDGRETPSALAAQMSLDGFWDFDIAANEARYSARWQAILGFPPERVWAGLEHWIDRVHPQDHASLINDLRALRKGYAHTMQNEHRIRDVDGHWRWVLVRATAETGRGGAVSRIAGVMTDQTARKLRDPLTGLLNRPAMIEQLEARIEQARGGNSTDGQGWDFAVVSLLLEQFKVVNESLGYTGGDALLLEIAARLKAAVRSATGRTPLIARLNGADFLVLLEGVRDDDHAMELGRAILAEASRVFLWGRRKLQPSIALGVTKANPRIMLPEDLMHEADTALLAARTVLPAQLVCYSTGMRERALARLQMEADLEIGIRNGHLVLHYQPEIDLRTRRIAGFEALVRWDHPERGLIPPGEFIPLAEDTGLIHALSDWGLKEACRQIVEWSSLADSCGSEEALLAKSALRVSVNLSGEDFARPGLPERIAGLLADYGIAPRTLCLEVTESSLMVHAEAALETMESLRALGVGLHMDDFGTGYSSLNYLHRFPFDTLKIDRSFIRELFDYRGSAEIVRSIVELSHSLGLEVVAEGIETAEQLAFMQTLNCRLGQGYYFARPMPAREISAMLQPASGPQRSQMTTTAAAEQSRATVS